MARQTRGAPRIPDLTPPRYGGDCGACGVLHGGFDSLTLFGAGRRGGTASQLGIRKLN